MSGKTKISLSDFEDCNKTTDGDCSVSEQCCCFHEMTFDLDYDTKISVSQFKVVNTSILIKHINLIKLKSFYQKVDFNFFTNLPPPSGYELLKIVQVFRL